METLDLSPKQEAFALRYLEIGNQSQAYRYAYNTQNMSDAAVRVEACRLLKHPKIALTLAREKRNNRRETKVTVETISQYLLDAQEMAIANNAPGVAVKAAMALAKLHGLIPPPRKQVEVQRCSRCEQPPRSSAEIDSEISALIDRLADNQLKW